ncbi:hypothetical protein MIR68_006888 [Amoeboaphelidium protococcarum]|nr:hypothetical protein MIR68_006888 [Amoeboaphelidium protococcarum]
MEVQDLNHDYMKSMWVATTIALILYIILKVIISAARVSALSQMGKSEPLLGGTSAGEVQGGVNSVGEREVGEGYVRLNAITKIMKETLIVAIAIVLMTEFWLLPRSIPQLDYDQNDDGSLLQGPKVPDVKHVSMYWPSFILWSYLFLAIVQCVLIGIIDPWLGHDYRQSGTAYGYRYHGSGVYGRREGYFKYVEVFMDALKAIAALVFVIMVWTVM